MKLLKNLSVLLFSAGLATTGQAEGYSNHPSVPEFISTMVSEHGFTKEEITKVLNKAEKKQAILDAIARPAEKTKPWYEYRKIFLGADRVKQGVEFVKGNQVALEKAEQDFGVSRYIITAIIGVETRYGRYMGSYRVVDALSTLGFDYPPRSKFFRGQLEQLFLLAREQKQDPLVLMGSYAGAMGFGQFIPSSYRHYARDYDGDDFADIWNNKVDAIGSVANYFKAHGWQTDKAVMVAVDSISGVDKSLVGSRSRPKMPVSDWLKKGVKISSSVPKTEKAVLIGYQQPEQVEHWFGFNNFYVITRYNRSHMYARAVWELSEEIRSLDAELRTTKSQ